jgi:exonuclease III
MNAPLGTHYALFQQHLHVTSTPAHGGHYGDPLILPKPSAITRCEFRNVNGLQLDKKGYQLRDVFEQERDIEADLFGITETKLNQQNSTVTKAYHQAAKQTYGMHHAGVLGGSDIHYDNTIRYGGTLTMAVQDIRGRVLNKISDPWGRWTALELQARGQRRVIYITAYQVCATPTNSEGSTAFHQQEAMARLEHRPNFQPRRNFQHDLRKFILCKIQLKYSIVLGGDFNESLDQPRSAMRELSAACGLTDVWAHRNPGEEFNTRHPGKKRIDYVLVSPDVVPCVSAVGYFPFKYRGNSDHRSIYVDFDTTKLFGNETTRLANLVQRGLSAKDPFATAVYLRATGKHATANNLFALSDRLCKLTTPDHALAEKIDDILGQAMLHGDNKCRSRRTPWWSRKLHRLRLWKSILQRLLSGFNTNGNFDATLQTLLQDHEMHNKTLPANRHDCKRSLTEVSKAIRELENNSAHQRRDEQVAAAEIYDATGQKDKATLVKEIRQAEAMSDTFRLFTNIRSKQTTSSLTQIEIPHDWPPPHTPYADIHNLTDPKAHAETDNPSWKLITLPDEINYYLLLRNQRHFGQAQGTPFTIPPLSDDIDWAASSAASDAILEGTYETSNLNHLLQAVLRECQYKTPADSISGNVTTEDFLGKFRTWNEKTTTSPSGRHLGLYKALVARLAPDDPADNAALESTRQSLTQVHINLINYCLRFRYSLQRWQEIVNAMILKAPGDFRIHRLRIIHLYEADFNFILSIKWRQLLHHADQLKLIHRGQYGGRPGKEATTLAFIEELKTDICYASRKPMINFDNDAASCYDRIIAAIASIIARAHGQHRDVCFVHADTLRQAKFRLKTAMGVSDAFYTNCKAYPIFGTGQGSGNSPVIWVFISSVLFTCHENMARGAVFESPDKSVTIRFFMVGFVDDSTGQVNDFLSDATPPLDSLIKMMAADAQLWNDLLHVSGGLLEVSKCSYHILYFAFRPSGIPFMKGSSDGPPLPLQDSATDTRLHVACKSAFMTHKTLGHFKAPAGNSTTHLKMLTKKTTILSRQLASSPATRAQALLFYWAIYLATIRYSLPQCFFSPAALHRAQSKSIPMILAKSGYMRTTSYSILFGPRKFGGGGFIRWYVLQGEGQILLFIKHWRCDEDAGRLLRIAVAWVQYQSGLDTPIFEDVHTPLPYLEARWLPSLRLFLAFIDAKLVLDKPYIAPLQRHNDEYLMRRILDTGIFSASDLHIINCCRLYLDVITVSDLLTACGLFMDCQVFLHEPSLSSSSNYHRAVQHKPQNWDMWDRAMSIWFTDTGVLRLPLGNWLYSGDRLRRTWRSYWDDLECTVYCQTVDGFSRCESQPPHGYAISEMTDWQPTEHSFPVHLQLETGQYFKIRRSIQNTDRPPPIVVPSTFEQYVNTLPAWERDLLSHVTFLLSPYQMLELFESAPVDTDHPLQIQLVSDGSQIRDRMSFGWSLSTPEGTRLATCAGPGFGPGTSHRAEGYGVLSAVRFVYRLHTFTGSPAVWSARFTTDNKGLLIRIDQRQQFAKCYANVTLAPDWDLVEEIVCTLKLFHVTPSFSHVKGHQDDATAYADLSLEAQLNVEADALAGDFQTTFPSATLIAPLLSTTGVSLTIRDATVTGHYPSRIREAATTPELLGYLRRRNFWTHTDWACIDIPVYQRIIARNSHRHVNVVKFIHDKLPTATIRQYTDSHIHTRCLLCHDEIDSFSHVIRCAYPTRKAWRDTLLLALRSYCETSATRLVLLQILTKGLQCWFRGEILPTTSFPAAFHQLIEEQNSIGWYALLRGFVSKQWAVIQHAHFYHNDNVTITKTGSLWITGLLAIVWDQIFLLWKLYKDTLHGVDAKAQTAILTRHLRRKIQALHDRQDDVRAADRRWFISDLQRYLANATVAKMQSWLSTYEPILHDAIRLGSVQALVNTRSLRNYFPTTVHPRNPRHLAATINPRLHPPARKPRHKRGKPPQETVTSTVRAFFNPVCLTTPCHPAVPTPTAAPPERTTRLITPPRPNLGPTATPPGSGVNPRLHQRPAVRKTRRRRDLVPTETVTSTVRSFFQPLFQTTPAIPSQVPPPVEPPGRGPLQSILPGPNFGPTAPHPGKSPSFPLPFRSTATPPERF